MHQGQNENVNLSNRLSGILKYEGKKRVAYGGSSERNNGGCERAEGNALDERVRIA